MRLRNCNFSTWRSNHDDDHKDKIYRSLYPYSIFRQIDFDLSFINIEQEIDLSYSLVVVKITKFELQENQRYRVTFSLKTEHKNFYTKWKFRTWEEKFQIVFSQDYDFVTAFTKNEDSSKKYLKNFFDGKFDKITPDRSIPISDLLFKSLVSLISEKIFGIGDYEKDFANLEKGVRSLRIPKSFEKGRKRKDTIYPLYSKNREIWVMHCFTEEDAHKIAYFNCNQCDKLYVVYCNPVYTKHFRCKHENVFVVSLFEFTYIYQNKISNIYSDQIRYLQNHLHIIPTYDIKYLIAEIDNPTNTEYEIFNSELLESLAIMKIFPSTNADLLLYISAMNLLNSWINRSRKNASKIKLFRNMYFFKTYLGDALSQILLNDEITDYQLYVENDLLIIEIDHYQFSFHNVPINNQLKIFMESCENKKIEWKGKRLQPLSPLLFRLVKERNKNST